MSPLTEGFAKSVHVRLVRHAHDIGADPNVVLGRFAVERFLYRLSRSRHADRFVLKGAFLLLAWMGETFRPTRDADLLGFGDLSDAALGDTMREVCGVEVSPDGMLYDAGAIEISSIRREDVYGGKRVMLLGHLGSARLSVQLDIGIGDAVTPEPDWLEYPSLLGLPSARLRAYRRETVVAEKVHAMVELGSKNSRMRDFFDVHTLAERASFTGAALAAAVRATFERRGTAIPKELPLALTPEFARSTEKRAQWASFRLKSGISGALKLDEITEQLAPFLAPVLDAARTGKTLSSVWPPGGPWQAETATIPSGKER